jgi:radical SAM superfamily enzyme YgiQ (UPF0313 family)
MVDDNITLDLKHFEAVCDAILTAGLNHLHYTTQASVQGLSSSRALVRKMARAGFKTVFLGIENADPGNLEFLNKDNQVTRERTEQAVAYLRENRIIVLGATIVGNPDDTETTMWQNFHFLKQLKVDGALFFNPTPLPQTRLREDMARQGLLVNTHDFSWYMGNKPNCRTHYLSPREINRIVVEMNEQYLDLDLLLHNRVWTHYPGYLLKRLFREAAEKIWKTVAPRLGLRDRDPLRAFLKTELRRRKKWLLDDLNRTCNCWFCTYAREGEERRGEGVRR